MHDQNDIFIEDGDNESDEKAILSKNWKRLVEPIKQEGFREGVAAGREETFQKGFDEGYSIGFESGMSIGLYNSVLKALQNKKLTSPDLEVGHLKPFDNPARGLCHLCTKSGKMLDKLEMTSNLEKSASIPLEDIISKQQNIVETAVSERQRLPEYVKVLDKLGVNLNVLDDT